MDSILIILIVVLIALNIGIVLFLIKNRDQLKSIRDNLLKERGDKGAAKKLASIIVNSIKKL